MESLIESALFNLLPQMVVGSMVSGVLLSLPWRLQDQEGTERGLLVLLASARQAFARVADHNRVVGATVLGFGRVR